MTMDFKNNALTLFLRVLTISNHYATLSIRLFHIILFLAAGIPDGKRHEVSAVAAQCIARHDEVLGTLFGPYGSRVIRGPPVPPEVILGQFVGAVENYLGDLFADNGINGDLIWPTDLSRTSAENDIHVPWECCCRAAGPGRELRRPFFRRKWIRQNRKSTGQILGLG